MSCFYDHGVFTGFLVTEPIFLIPRDYPFPPWYSRTQLKYQSHRR